MKQYAIKVNLLCVAKFGSGYGGIFRSSSNSTMENDFIGVIRFISIVLCFELSIRQAQSCCNFTHYQNCKEKSYHIFCLFFFSKSQKNNRLFKVLTRYVDGSWNNARLFQFIRLSNINQCFLRMIG